MAGSDISYKTFKTTPEQEASFDEDVDNDQKLPLPYNSVIEFTTICSNVNIHA